MYDELIAELRQHHCDAKEDDTQEVCEECAYDVIIADESVPSGIASVCVCGLMNRAADAIEELSKPHWISVEERLPEHLTSVIVHRKNGGIFVWEFFNTSPTDECWIDDSMNVYSFYDVTHWMPLPSTEGLNEA